VSPTDQSLTVGPWPGLRSLWMLLPSSKLGRSAKVERPCKIDRLRRVSGDQQSQRVQDSSLLGVTHDIVMELSKSGPFSCGAQTASLLRGVAFNRVVCRGASRSTDGDGQQSRAERNGPDVESAKLR
jgi:hypothetical protein